MHRFLRSVIAAGLVTVVAGCPQETLECVAFDPDCAPLYEPTWGNVFANTLAPKCGVGGGACHGGAAAIGGLQLDEIDRAHATLLTAGKTYVIPGDPSCSEIVERMHTSSSRLMMPRGSRLPASEICAIEQWIAVGAPGPETPDAGVDATVTRP